MTKIIAVHDIFEMFASQAKEILTYSQLLTGNFFETGYLLELGQGFANYEIKTLAEKGYCFSNKENLKAEEKKYVHKKSQRNVIITLPFMLSKQKKFISHLVLSHEMDLVADHITGLHIPAIILIEAARQAMLSIFGRFYGQGKGVRFTILSIHSEFYAFVFPVCVQIISDIVEVKQKKGFLISIIEVKIMQHQKICACVKIEFMCGSEQVVLRKERISYARLAF